MRLNSLTVFLLAFFISSSASAAYLNYTNIFVELGSSMPANPFANRGAAESLASIIDLPSATAPEDHDQTTHVWVSGGSLELDFDFGAEYALSQIHFWNYFTEQYDVDNVDMTFYDSTNSDVGSIPDFDPGVWLAGSNPIFANTHALAFPKNVQFVNMVLTGTNNQVDFNNIGFTGERSVVPIPAAVWLFGTGLLSMIGLAKRRKAA